MEESEVKKTNKTLLILISFSLVILIVASAIILSAKFVWNEDDKSSESSGFKLEIQSPADSVATSQSTVKISGETNTSATVTLANSVTQKIVSTADGKFSAEITLVEGKNIINITAYDTNTGQSKTITREILYLNEDLSQL